jgi:DNA-binding beta-propeller fold protein YncE
MLRRRFLVLSLNLLLILLAADSASAYKVTPLKHLFDIEHGFLQPSDVAIGKDLKIYVLDGVNSQVKVFDEKGTFLFAFGSKGNGKVQFESPLGLTTDSAGRVYVADTGNRRIQIFAPDGKYANEFPVQTAKGSLHPSDPVDLALDEQRNTIYVVDNDNHQVRLYSFDKFNYLESWGKEGDGRQDFRYPFFIAVGKDRVVLIVDVINTRVQAWDPRGKALSTIGEWGVDTGQLFRPKGVCVDSANRVFVSDSYLGVIQVFNRYGSFLSVLGDESGKIMKWKSPVGMAIDYQQRLYVVDMIANRVQVYQILENDIEVAK